MKKNLITTLFRLNAEDATKGGARRLIVNIEILDRKKLSETTTLYLSKLNADGDRFLIEPIVLKDFSELGATIQKKVPLDNDALSVAVYLPQGPLDDKKAENRTNWQTIWCRPATGGNSRSRNTGSRNYGP